MLRNKTINQLTVVTDVHTAGLPYNKSMLFKMEVNLMCFAVDSSAVMVVT